MTPRDKLSYMLTMFGTFRRLASFAGVSHQRIGRVMAGTAGAKALANADAAIAETFELYKSMAHDQALEHGLPFHKNAPVFYQRLKRQDGSLGDRVAAFNTQWLSAEQRELWLTAQQQSARFYAVSVQSLVNLAIYFKRGETLYKGRRDERRSNARDNIKRKLVRGVVNGPIFTEYTSLSPQRSADRMLYELNDKLEKKHYPAIGEPGTAVATSILLQVDTRANRDAKFRRQHPHPKKKRARRS